MAPSRWTGRGWAPGGLWDDRRHGHPYVRTPTRVLTFVRSAMPQAPHAPLAATVAGLMPRAKAELAELVAYRSVADPRQFPASECENAARWVADALRAEGFEDVALLDTPDGTQSVYGFLPGPPGAPTVLLYAHYDVQPPLDEAAWTTPPFELTERDGRWYGRGAAACKGGVILHLLAPRALTANRA